MNKLIDWISVVAQSTGWLFIYCFQVGLENGVVAFVGEKKKMNEAGST